MRSAGWKWYHAAALAGAAVGTAMLAWWLLREEQKEDGEHGGDGSRAAEGAAVSGDSGGLAAASSSSSALPANITANTATKEQVLQILQRVVDSQEEVRRVMCDVTQSLLDRPNDGFPEVYQRVAAAIPEDPLEAAGINMVDFDMMLERYSVDPEVRNVIERIMGMPGTASTSAAAAAEEGERKLSKDDVIEIHGFMLEQLKKVVAEIKRTSADDKSLDLRTLTVAAQALVSAQVMQKFGVTSEAVERAVFAHQQQLTMSMDFTRVNMEIQATMGELVGQWPPSM